MEPNELIPLSFDIANDGGGIYTHNDVIKITNSTFDSNKAAVGSGLYNFGDQVTIASSTFANNRPPTTGSNGSSTLYNNGSTTTITNSTFADNIDGLMNYAGTINVAATIVAKNTGGNCSGTITDQGNNLESGTDCGFTASTDQQNTDPQFVTDSTGDPC
jgi:hypothetical protein